MLLRSLILPSRESPFFDAVGRPSSASASSAAPTTASIRVLQAAPTLLPLAVSARVLPSFAACEATLRSKGISTSTLRSIDCSKSLRLLSGAPGWTRLATTSTRDCGALVLSQVRVRIESRADARVTDRTGDVRGRQEFVQ